MAYLEPMDVDIGNDFDDKENSIQKSNVLPRTPCTEKGYEELDVSELNMKLRYSITPASSPMSKSYTNNYKENKIVSQDDILNNTITNENCNLTRSLNSSLPKSETISKSPKLPLQVMSNDQFLNNTMSSSLRRSIDTDANCTVTLSRPDNIDETLSIPSTSSSSVHTPEAITPTKDIPKDDGGSPIMRGLKSVLNMFRSSQSPIPSEDIASKDVNISDALSNDTIIPPATLASTPIHTNKNKECNSSKRNSPLKDSVIFNDDLEKELQWKEETTIIFKQEKIPIQKLLFQYPLLTSKEQTPLNKSQNVEYMDISYNESGLADKTMTEIENKTISNIIEASSGMESDSEFVDCETIYTKNEEQSKSEFNTLVSDDNANKNTYNINTEAFGKHIDEEFVTLDNATNEIASEDSSQIKTILPDILIATDIIHDVKNHDEKLTTEDIVTHNVELNVTDDMCKLSKIENEIQLEIYNKSNIQLQNDVFSEANSAQEKVVEEVTSAMENKQENNSDIEYKNPHNVTKPLNIETDCSNNENTNNSVDYLQNEYYVNCLQNSGLLKRCDVEEIVSKIEILQNDNEESHSITMNKDENVNLTLNISHLNNESIPLNSSNITSTTFPNIEKHPLGDDFIDNNCIDNIESNKNETTDQVINADSNNYEVNGNVIHDDVNLNFQTPVCSDVTFDNITTTNSHCINTDESNNVIMNNKSMEESNEELKNVHETQEPSPNTLSSSPSDCPLPFDDDMDIHNLKDSLKAEVNNIISDNDNLKNISAELPNVNLENININSVEVEIKIPNESEVSETVNKSTEITDFTEPVKSGVPPDHLVVLDNMNAHTDSTNTNTFMNDSNDNMQSLEKDNLGNQQEVNIDTKDIIDNVMPSLSNTVLHNDEVNNINNDIKEDGNENPFETKTKLQQSPPISPKLSRKGYTINFDEIDDPFATKTAIRTTPPPEAAININVNNASQKKIDQKRIQMQNRRKSQPERKRQSTTKKPFNKSFESGLTKRINEEPIDISRESLCDDAIIKTRAPNTCLGEEVVTQIENNIQVDCKDFETQLQDEVKFNIKEVKNEVTVDNKVSEICSKESSITSNVNKSVFNLPEIDDMNFNPFASKSKIRQSPPLETKVSNNETENQSQLVNDITINIDKAIQEQGQIISPSASSLDSSKAIGSKDCTTPEVKTEDEDTIEGPFFEADDLTEAENQSNFEVNNDEMPFEDFPVESNTDKNEELFIDAEAFEFLLNQNKSNVVADSGKESLFLKFDPLFAKRVSSDGVLSALNRIQKKQSTPVKSTKADKMNGTAEPATASTARNVSEEAIDETNIMTSKPMMVVNPAVNSLVSPRKSITPPRINRRSLTFTSPAMAVIDRLLSLSGNTSLLDHDTSIPQSTRECNDTDIALTQLRELLAEKEIHVHNLRSETKELKERLATMESQVRTLEKESEVRLRKVNDLNERLAEKTKMNKSMAVVVEEYERTIASLIADMDQENRRNAEERAMLISERDEQTAHLASMEASFSDLHSKYEKSKQIILSMKANEDTYKKSIKDFEDSLLKMQNNYELLKQHATSKLNHANQELEKFNRSHEAEVLKLNAMIKRKELLITSLEESLTQKTKANEELTAICDELINKVG